MDSQAVKFFVVATLLIALSLVGFALRLRSASLQRRSLQLHDWLCLLSAACLVIHFAATAVGVVHGDVGLHVSEVPPSKIVVALKESAEARLKARTVVLTALQAFFAGEPPWATSVAAFRLSILALYITVFRTRRFYIAAVTTATLVACYWLASILTIFLLCRPINFNWNKSTASGVCGNVTATELASAIFNMIIDILVVCLPMPIIWKLQMPTRKIVGVSAVFALGLCIAGINVGRLVQTLVCPSEDVTYCFLDSALLVEAEMSVGILVACVPTFGPVFFERQGPQYRQDKPPTDWGTPDSRRRLYERNKYDSLHAVSTQTQSDGYDVELSSTRGQ